MEIGRKQPRLGSADYLIVLQQLRNRTRQGDVRGKRCNQISDDVNVHFQSKEGLVAKVKKLFSKSR